MVRLFFLVGLSLLTPLAAVGQTNVCEADQQTGATADAKIIKCVTLLTNGTLGTDGGIIDARGFGDTVQTIANQVTLGNSTFTHSETLLINPATQFSCTATSGACFEIWQGSNMIGGPGDSGVVQPNRGIVLASGASVSNLVLLIGDSNHTSSRVSGFQLQADTGSVSDAVVGVQNVYQTTVIDDLDISSTVAPVGLKLYDTESHAGGNITVSNTNSGAGCCGTIAAGFTPVWIGCATAGSTASVACSGIGSITFLGGSYAHPGSSAPAIIDIEGTQVSGEGPVTAITFVNPQLESSNATDVGILDNGAESMTLVGGIATSQVSGADIVKIENPPTYGILDDVNMSGLDNQGGWTHAVNNTVTGYTFPFTSGRINYHYFAPRSEPGVVFDANNGIGFGAGTTAANLSSSAPAGTIIYCKDCTISNPCAGGGTGAIAKRLNGSWVCN